MITSPPGRGNERNGVGQNPARKPAPILHVLDVAVAEIIDLRVLILCDCAALEMKICVSGEINIHAAMLAMPCMQYTPLHPSRCANTPHRSTVRKI